MKQYARNACGTVGVVHAIINNKDHEPGIIKENSFLDKFTKENQNKNAHQIGMAFLGSNELKENHKQASSIGQSAEQENVDTHFICFVEKDG